MAEDRELDERLARLESRLRVLESAGPDPWASQPTFLDRPHRAPSLEGPTVLPPSAQETFPAAIVTDATGGAYTFKEKVLTDGTTWADLTGGRTGTCYEANDVAGIVVGTIIKIRVEYDTGGTLRYVFDSGVGTIPPGTVDNQVLVWTAAAGWHAGYVKAI